ncbi:retroviral-like aspartic protease family protein [Psychrosphaera algicola]|uniref:Aspartyl protease family protein n=1 Tax=Psychrosphaera algicola TaxID=3023714 RepID=A0ABT5FF66_9GAMM|nr:retroviral-like aspartic protease family protein [Psychrosphaera sp. G1-22]MDC2889251.1 aspartyl protease family protein [Psychrosphaera sp. G1-22]
MYKQICVLLAVLLSISVGVNFYLFKTLHSPNTNDEQPSPLTPNNTTATTIAIEPKLTEQDNSDLDAAIRAFSEHDFALAIEKYDDLIKLEEQSALQLRHKWRLKIKYWLDNNELILAKQFLQTILHYQPFATDFLELEAYRQELNGNFIEAIDLYYLILSDTFDPAEQIRLTVLLHATIQQYQTLLSNEQQWQEIITLLERAIYEEPEHLSFQLSLAQTLVKLGQYERAKVLLDDIIEQQEYEISANELLEQIEKLEIGQQAIPLQQAGSHYLVTGQFGPQSSVALMIDTGASMSVLTQQHFDNLVNWQYPTYVRTSEFNTAGGLVDAPIYRFDRFSIGGFTVNDIEFAVINMPEFSRGSGLLGMNFLQHFVFQIDQQDNQLILQHR